MDADGWKRILTSREFAESSTDLCKTIANMIKKLCIDKDLANTLEAFLSCCLVPLDKNPGLRPIGVGEVLRRIVGKVIVSTLRDDIITTVAPLQVCTGQESGSIHIFNDTNIQITTQGRRHLGAALGTSQFRNAYIMRISWKR